MSELTVEEQINLKFPMPMDKLLTKLIKQGLTSRQIADKLDCGVSNVRSIARKYNIKFHQPSVAHRNLSHNNKFLDKDINNIHFLYRVWQKREEVEMA